MSEYVDGVLYKWLIEPNLDLARDPKYLYKISLDSYYEGKEGYQYFISKKWELIYCSTGYTKFKGPLLNVTDQLILKKYKLCLGPNEKEYFDVCKDESKLKGFFIGGDYWVMKNDICLIKNFKRQYFPYNFDDLLTSGYYIKLFGTPDEKKGYINMMTQRVNQIKKNANDEIERLQNSLRDQVKLYEDFIESIPE